MRCEPVTTSYEGGYANNPLDKGGPTFRGITLRALSDYCGRPATISELIHLTESDVAVIYRQVYWAHVNGDELPAGLDMMLFDAAVNSGRRRSVAFMQGALGFDSRDIDGDLGPVTMQAILGANDRTSLIKRASANREHFLRGLGNFPTFGRGWIKRLDGVTAMALGWALTDSST